MKAFLVSCVGVAGLLITFKFSHNAENIDYLNFAIGCFCTMTAMGITILLDDIAESVLSIEKLLTRGNSDTDDNKSSLPVDENGNRIYTYGPSDD